MSIWEVLGIHETKDKEAIRGAYHLRLSVTNPEDSPEAFMRLRAAFEEALKAADKPENGDMTEAEEQIWDDSPVGNWMKQVDELYRHFSMRIDPQRWRALLQEDVCQNLDTRLAARDALLEYLLDHFFLPQSVVRVLNEAFELTENMEELAERFPRSFLDVVIAESAARKEYPPYESLYGDDSLPFESFLRLSSALNNCIGEGDSQKARELLAQMEATGIRSPYLQIEKAKICCQEENYTAARDAIGELLPEYEDLTDVKLMKGDICFYLDADIAAEKEYLSVLQEDPASDWARFGLGKCKVKQGNYQEANEIFCRLLEENPYDAGAQEWLYECNERYLKSLEQRLPESGDDQGVLMEMGWCYFQNERYDEVLALLSDVVPQEEHQIEYRSLMGRASLYTGDSGQAIEHLQAWERSLRQLPDTPENKNKKEEQLPYALLLLSGAYEKQGDRKTALSLLAQLLEQNPHDGEALQMKGQILYGMWDFEGAIDTLSRAIEEEPNSHVPFLLRAEAFYRLDYYGEAFDDCEKSLELFPYELTAYVYKVKILTDAGEFEGAEETIAFLEKEELSGSELEFLKGYIMEGKGEHAEAERIYRSLIEAGSGDRTEESIFAVDNLAETYFRLAALLYDADAEDFTPLVRLIDKGLEQDENYVPLIDMKAEVAYQCGRHDEALRLCKKMLAIAPGKIGTYGMMDSIYRELEDWESALQYAELQLRQAESAYAYMRRGQIFTCLDRTDEAWEDFCRAIAMDPDLEYTYNYMGVILEFKGKEAEALEYYEKAIAVGERVEEICEEAYSNASNLYCRRGEYEKAADTLKRAYELTGNTKYIYEQIEIQRLAGSFEQAAKTLRAYAAAEDLETPDFLYRWEEAHIRRDERQTEAAFFLYNAIGAAEPAGRREAGKILYYQGHYRKALKYFRKAIAQLDEDHSYEEETFVEAAYYLWAARACLKLGRKKEAAFYAAGGFEKIPGDFEQSLSHCLPMIYQLMGALHSVRGDFEQARIWLEKALNMRVCDYCNYRCCVDALYELGYLHECKGQSRKALEYYEEGLRYAPVDSDLSCAAANMENRRV